MGAGASAAEGAPFADPLAALDAGAQLAYGRDEEGHVVSCDDAEGLGDALTEAFEACAEGPYRMLLDDSGVGVEALAEAAGAEGFKKVAAGAVALHLSGNRLDGFSLGLGLAFPARLRQLNLSGNNITELGAEALECMPQLVDLDVSYNAEITIPFGSCGQLLALNVAGCEWSTLFLNGVSLLAPLAKLRILSLAENEFATSADIVTGLKPLATNGALEELDVSENPIEDNGESFAAAHAAIQAALPSLKLLDGKSLNKAAGALPTVHALAGENGTLGLDSADAIGDAPSMAQEKEFDAALRGEVDGTVVG